jgi:hypothetical protein
MFIVVVVTNFSCKKTYGCNKEYGWNGFIAQCEEMTITTSEQFIADRTVYCVLIKYNQ